MVKSKHLRDTVTAWFLGLLSFSAGVQAEVSPRSTGDELLQILPAESLFCVRVNNFNSTLGTIDQFLADISGRPAELSRTVRQKVSGMLNSPKLNGVNMVGNFAIFGVSAAEEKNIFYGVLIPITDYKQFIDGITNISQPDDDGFSKIRNTILVKQVGNYALCLQGEYEKLTTISISISEGKMAGLDSVLDAAEVQQAIEEPLWAYGNVQQAGPFLSNQLEQMRTMMENMESHTQANIEKLERTRKEMANMIFNRKVDIEKIYQQIEKLKEQWNELQVKIGELENHLDKTDPNKRAEIIKQKTNILKQLKELSNATQARFEKLEQLRNQLADIEPNENMAIRTLDQQIEKIRKKKELSSYRQASETIGKAMNLYAAILETLIKETKSLSLTVRPRPNVFNLTMNVSAVPGTEMANMFVADTSIVKENRLLGYLKDGAMMNFACKMNTPFWNKLKLKSVDFLSAIAGESMTAEDITKAKTLASDGISALGGAVAFSFFIDANSKPPFAFKYVLEVKDVDKFNNVLEEASEMMNVGSIADFYKSMGIEMGFTIKRGVGSYKGVSIDSAKLVMKSTDPNSPRAQMMSAMYGDGLKYKWSMIDGLFVCAGGGDVDSAIFELIDEVKAGGPMQIADEMKAALALLPEAGKAEFMGTYNIPRLFKMSGAMVRAFMPAPMLIAQMDIPTKSNIVFAGKASNGEMTVDIALPKEHLTEIVAAFQPPLDKAREQGKRAVSLNNLKQIALACIMYADDHEGKFPDNLEQLYPYHRNPRILESPRKPKDFIGPSYIYVTELKLRMRDVSRIIIFYENPAFCSDGICVAFLDGHCEWMKSEEFLERLKDTYKQLGREMPEIKFKSPTRPTAPQKMPQPTMQPQKVQEARVIITKANLKVLHTAIM